MKLEELKKLCDEATPGPWTDLWLIWIQDLVDELDKLADPPGGSLEPNHGASELIGMLEERFYAILREYEVELDETRRAKLGLGAEK